MRFVDKKKKIAICSFIMSLVSLIPAIILPDSLIGAEIFIIIGMLLAIAAIVLGFVGKSGAKGFSIAGIVIGIVSLIVLCLSIIGILGMKSAKNCVDKGNGMATCEYMGQEVEVPTTYLTEEQMKRGE